MAEAAGGATVADVAAAAAPYGLTPVAGTVGSVGMAGLTMAGGYGALAGLGGLAVDALLGADVVLPDGTEVVAETDPDPGDPRGDEHVAWATETAAALEPHALPGGYVNLLGPDDTDRVRAAYGPNLDRLLALKRRYDPDRVVSAVPTLPR